MDSGPEVYFQIIILILLTLVNAFFAASEMAIVSMDKKKLLTLSEQGDKRAIKVEKLLKEPSKFLSTIQVGITFAGFFTSASAAVGLSHKFGNFLENLSVPFAYKVSFVLITVILAFFSLVFGELVPKRIALQNAEKFALFSVGTINFVYKIMSPFVYLLSLSTNVILKIFSIPTSGVEAKVTLEEIKSIVEVGQEQGIINPTEREMIDGVISFDDVLAEEVMTARTEVFMIDIDEPDKDFETLMQMRYSRVPVYEGDIDNIIGILYIKDFFLEAYKVGFKNVNIRSILRPAYFIPERKNINDLFLELKNSRNQMAVLIDEYGGFTGIVTMEDLIEEVMGEIDDEYDKKTNPAIKKIDDRHFIATGACEIEDVNNACNLKLDENSEDYDTLGGMLMYLLGYIPNDGEKLTIEDNGVIYNILSIYEHRVKKVRIVLPKEEVVETDKDENEEKNSEK
ncbi:hemolysin family protein [Parvimonas micra]|uniref:hemolysin family protein n=1 Tax=Parvimonas micra TaxID=33033 RepID=UPI0020048247|nr:hemolysin family protein [Parvimonas micra]MCK6129989.1 hemolysin family protein [Parvimonas micra]MCK6135635.1 hemolysin family protein [Parvimonas micra]MCK6137107.1 hemolysin family protein [Parvimonas micra]MCK6153634.1 hemolysin family protein [Parvimonas micra]